MAERNDKRYTQADNFFVAESWEPARVAMHLCWLLSALGETGTKVSPKRLRSPRAELERRDENPRITIGTKKKVRKVNPVRKHDRS